MAHRVGRVVAVMEQVGVGGVARPALIHPVGLNQLEKRRRRQVKGLYRLLQGHHNRVFRRAGIAGLQFRLPPGQQGQAVGSGVSAKICRVNILRRRQQQGRVRRAGWGRRAARRGYGLIPQIINRAAVGIDGVNVAQFIFGQQTGADGEVLIMSAGQPLTIAVSSLPVPGGRISYVNELRGFRSLDFNGRCPGFHIRFLFPYRTRPAQATVVPAKAGMTG